MAVRSRNFLGSSQVVLFWLIFFGMRVFAQQMADVPNVHILPPAAAMTMTTTSLKTPIVPVIKKNVDLVLVPVTITDQSDRIITGLDRQNFKVYENKREQAIQHFSSEDVPISVGIILDTSGSMKTKMERAKEAVQEFCKAANPQDEFFMITFSNQPNLAGNFTTDPEELEHRLLSVQADGRTSLLDAIYLGLHKMRQAKQPRRALLIISDGGDNRSRYTEHEVTSLVKEADVMVYAIGIYDHTFPTEEEMLGPALLSTIAEVSGGKAFSVDDPNDLPAIAFHVGEELRNQYVLGYRPDNIPRDGKWHKIRVKLQMPAGWKFLHVRARTGYYAPAQ
ncbi:MAG TPA: VWA domain-containing protein [Terriglobales bacterium]|nr:VWA domain-containing protein [Terriglobales bacterium]